MAPSSSKANYKTYESQARMVRAIVAAHPEVKWNYKEIATCYGSDMTEHALNHRFRKIRAQALLIKEGRMAGFDMKHLAVEENELPSTKESVHKDNIAKYFGQSTADGIQFQFRAIKKDAEKLRSVESSGGDVASCLAFNGNTNSPSSRTSHARTPSSRKRAKQSHDTGDEDADDDDGTNGEEPDWSAKDEETPSKKRGAKKTAIVPGQKNGTPSRRAATKANATFAQLRQDAAADYDEDEDGVNEESVQQQQPAPIIHRSIFGGIERKPLVTNDMAINPGVLDSPLTSLSTDPYMSTTMNMTMYGGDWDGEI